MKLFCRRPELPVPDTELLPWFPRVTVSINCSLLLLQVVPQFLAQQILKSSHGPGVHLRLLEEVVNPYLAQKRPFQHLSVISLSAVESLLVVLLRLMSGGIGGLNIVEEKPFLELGWA